MRLGDKLTQALVWEDDENYEKLQEDQYSNEFIFCLFKFLVLGGGMCQSDEMVAEYLECTKSLYKDLVSVAKYPDTKEIRPLSMVFRIKSIQGQVNIKPSDHP